MYAGIASLLRGSWQSQSNYCSLNRFNVPFIVSSYWRVKGKDMNISAASKISGLPVKTVRYYADIKLVAAPHRSESGYRIYDNATVRKLVFVRRARQFGFSIGECRELLGLYEDQHRSSADVKRIAAKRLEEIERKQRELRSLHDELSHLIDACKGDHRPDCPIIDCLGERQAGN